MNTIHHSMIGWILGICLVILMGTIAFSNIDIPYDSFFIYAQEHRIIGAILFGCIMFGATIIAPIAVLPMVPLLAPILGPFLTGVSAYIGWTSGAIVAFWIARRFGQPLVLRFVRKKDLEKMSSYIDENIGFVTIVMLRLLLPVDVLSYAIGLFTFVSYSVYIWATLIGILWFPFAFAYMGTTLLAGDYVLLVGISVASVVILVLAWHFVSRTTKR